MTKEEFHQRLVAIKKEKDLTLEQMAGACKTSWPTMQRWVSGKTAPIALARDSVFVELEKL